MAVTGHHTKHMQHLLMQPLVNIGVGALARCIVQLRAKMCALCKTQLTAGVRPQCCAQENKQTSGSDTTLPADERTQMASATAARLPTCSR